MQGPVIAGESCCTNMQTSYTVSVKQKVQPSFESRAITWGLTVILQVCLFSVFFVNH